MPRGAVVTTSVEKRKAELGRLIRAAENQQEPGPPRLDSSQWIAWNGRRLAKIEALRAELKAL